MNDLNGLRICKDGVIEDGYFGVCHIVIINEERIMEKIHDMPKLESPFIRKEINGHYIVTDEINPGYEWVFTDEKVMAIEKLDGTNVSIYIEDGVIRGIWNRTERLPFFNKGKRHIIEGLLESFERGIMEFLVDGQHFGELIGPKVNGNPYQLKEHRWIPFSTFGQEHLRYKSWGKYPKDYKTISEWFHTDLMPLYSLMITGNKQGFVEGIVFTHPDGRMAKLRRDMFDWYYIDNPGKRQHKEEVEKTFSSDENKIT